MEKTIIEVLIAIVLASGVAMGYVYVRSRKSETKLEEFYRIVDKMRNHVHLASSMAEVRELHDEIDLVRESFEGEVSKVVIDKEMTLIISLLNRKIKKMK